MTFAFSVATVKNVKITYDPVKRLNTLKDRELDFEEVILVFAGRHFTRRDDRVDYGEDRFITIGRLRRAHGGSCMDPEGRDHPYHLNEEGQ